MNIDYTLWPNANGNLGSKKVQIPDGVNTSWPEGDALISNFVYKDGKLAGFVDTKALTVNDSKTTTFPYDYVDIQVDKSLEGVMTFNKGERTKYLTVSHIDFSNGDAVLIRFEDLTEEEKVLLRSATTIRNNTLYDENGVEIGTFNTRSLLTGSNISNMDDDLLNITPDSLFAPVDFSTYEERDVKIMEFDSDLSSLENGVIMFVGSPIISFKSDLSNLKYGAGMFTGCENLSSFSGNLNSLIGGGKMFLRMSVII